MTNLNLEIPPEVRDFAEKTVDQARKAFDGFVAAAQKASEQTEAAAESATAGVKEVSSKAISYAEANVKAAFDLAEDIKWSGFGQQRMISSDHHHAAKLTEGARER